ncbi:MAG TPA: helix-turn-helix domain-containing protein [Spirochaetota bacterium]
MNIVYLFGAGQGFLLALCLFIKKGKAAKIFSSLAFIVSFEILVEYVYVVSGWRTHWVFFFIKETLGFLYGPLLYIYVCVLTDRVSNFRKRDLLHFVPFFAYFLIDLNTAIPFLFDPYTLVYDINDRGVNLYREVVYYIRLGIIFIYLVASLVVIRAYTKKIGDYFSNMRRIGLNWLHILIIGAFFIWVTGFISTVIFIHYPEYMKYSARGFFLLMTLFVYTMGYFALTQPEIYSIIHGIVKDGELPSDDDAAAKARYVKNNLSPERMEEYRELIISCFERDKLYRDPDITLAGISERTKIPVHSVSQVINTTMKMNFYTLVNRYRIAYASELLAADDDETSIISVCFRSGFNSKSAFNSTFKRYTGITPTLFRQQQLDIRTKTKE